jgi:hypothetical protein
LIPRIKNPLALIHYFQYLNAKIHACSSSMHGSSWPSPY